MKSRLAVLAAGLLVMGCSADRAKVIQGKWRTPQVDGASAALKILAVDAVKGREAAALTTAKTMMVISLDVRPDKTFTLIWDGAERTGTWTFEKKSGDLNLNITRISPLTGAPLAQTFQPETWTSTLDKDNKQLNFFPGNAEVADFMKKSGGPLASGYQLVKQDG